MVIPAPFGVREFMEQVQFDKPTTLNEFRKAIAIKFNAQMVC